MKLYYEFLHFYNCTKINYIEFSKIGSYIKLQKIVGKSPEETWKEEELSSFRANYYYFKQLYESMGGKAIDLKLTPNVGYKKSLLEKLFNDEQKVAKVAFVHDKTPEESGWTYGHELGRHHVEKAFEGKIITKSYYSAMQAPEDIIEQAAKDDNEIIFTTSPKLLKASLAVAVKYPDKTILNCSLNKSHRYISTYYARMYEAKFIIGAIAGIMAENIALGAKGLGLGSVIIASIGGLLNEKEGIKWKQKLDIPEDYKFLIACAVGNGCEDPAPKPRKKEQFRVIKAE